jgi:multiple sugar transport system permease protein
VLFGLLTLRMFPHILLVIPFYMFARYLNMIDTYLVMILAFVALNQPFTIWLMRSFFVDIPTELDEAAHIDGCNNWQTFIRVVLPVARPGIAVTTLFSLQLSYNEFLFALILSGSHTKTLPVAIASFGAEDISYWSLSAAGAIGISLPILIFVLLMQRHLVRGLTLGAVK